MILCRLYWPFAAAPPLHLIALSVVKRIRQLPAARAVYGGPPSKKLERRWEGKSDGQDGPKGAIGDAKKKKKMWPAAFKITRNTPPPPSFFFVA